MTLQFPVNQTNKGYSNMASEETSEDSEPKQKDYNPKLDFFSDQFDPLLALRSDNLQVPVTSAPIYDNIHRYVSAVEGKKQTEKRSKKPEQEAETIIERRWQPHQLPIHTTRTTKTRNVFTNMEKMVGPLRLLNTCKESRQKIQVWTRRGHEIRGYCIAFVVAFDKHWNLALEDVEEVWGRPKKRKVPALEGSLLDPRIRPKVVPPSVTILKSTKQTETCSRHIKQLLLRGEHVAYIVVIPKETAMK